MKRLLLVVVVALAWWTPAGCVTPPGPAPTGETFATVEITMNG